MPSIPLMITPKWRSRPPILSVPGFGAIKRPGIGSILIVQSDYLANWLIDNGFAKLTKINRPKGNTGGEESGESGEEETPIKRQVVLGNNSELELDPPLITSVPGNGEELLIEFFNSSEPTEINGSIRAITLKMAQELKQANPLDWTAVVRILSDRALDAAAKWATQKQTEV